MNTVQYIWPDENATRFDSLTRAVQGPYPADNLGKSFHQYYIPVGNVGTASEELKRVVDLEVKNLEPSQEKKLLQTETTAVEFPAEQLKQLQAAKEETAISEITKRSRKKRVAGIFKPHVGKKLLKEDR